MFKFRGALCLVFLFSFLCFLSSCDKDREENKDSSGRLLPVTLSVRSLAGSGGDNMESKIVSLSVFIVDVENNVEKKLNLSDFSFSDGSYITQLELKEGAKKVYSYANCSPDFMSNVNDGNGFPSVSDNTFDAVSVISDENGIPMSSITDWMVNERLDIYSVMLIRMVAKMEVKVEGDKKVERVTIGKMKKNNTPFWLLSDNQLGEGSESLSFNSFPHSSYIHEVGGSFEVSVECEGENNPRTATFHREIPRNSIFPLFIHITDYSLEMDITATLAPIGGFPVEMKVTPDGYTVDLPEGCEFSIGLILKGKEAALTEEKVQWNISEEDEGVLVYDKSGGTIAVPITGHSPSYSVSPASKLKIKAVHGERTETFYLTINLRPLEEFVPTRSSKSESNEPLVIEL